MRHGRWKLLELRDHAQEDADAARYELYDVEADPQESVELSAVAPEHVKALKEALEAFSAGDGAAERADVQVA